jgi:hypothetical protein
MPRAAEDPYPTRRSTILLAGPVAKRPGRRSGSTPTRDQRQLGHLNLGTTSIYLQGIDPEEIIIAVRTRRAPMMCASAGLRL